MGYELLRMIDGGGMGVVYLARDHVTDRVAMKFLRGGLVSGSALDRFLVEVRALAALDHPNIVRVLATDFYRSDPFFTMEYQSGGTLAERVRSRGPLPPAEAAALIRTVAGAVAAAHAENILHRDLKPSNILLTADGTPKVSDFGLAKRTDKDDGITVDSVSLGTPGYMPPEQISKRHGEVGPASDVYGLGATLYHLLTGQAPFRGAPAEVMNRVLTELPQRPRAVQPEIPLALEAVVMKCLEKNPADRYPTPAALAADLDKYLAGLHPDAPQLTRPRRAWRCLRRNRVRVAGAALALVAALVLGAILRPEPEPAEQMRRVLKAGKSYAVVPETGPPRYHRWRLGGSAFGVSPTPEKACHYESMHHAMLELSPEDPGIDRYRVTFQLLHNAPLGGLESSKVDLSFVAFYWGHAEQLTPDGLLSHTFFALSYSDTKPDFELAGKPVHTFRPRSVALIPQPKGDPILIGRQQKPHAFRDEATPTGDWRSFRIDVAPERVRVEWKNAATGNYERLLDLTGEAIQKAYARIQPDLPPGVIVPAWSPRLPMGIWSSRAAVSVKNFVLTPLNPDSE